MMLENSARDTEVACGMHMWVEGCLYDVTLLGCLANLWGGEVVESSSSACL